MTIIIGITGISGAGKTTFATRLAEQLDATRVHWDDFNCVSKMPRDLIAWHKAGRDYQAFQFKTLATGLETLKNNKPIKHPIWNFTLEPAPYIIFDAPFGRLHHETGQFIDFCIHLDTPLDVALARRTIRDFKNTGSKKVIVLNELEFYLEHTRPLYCGEKLKQTADLVCDSWQDMEAEIAKIEGALRSIKNS